MIKKAKIQRKNTERLNFQDFNISLTFYMWMWTATRTSGFGNNPSALKCSHPKKGLNYPIDITMITMSLLSSCTDPPELLPGVLRGPGLIVLCGVTTSDFQVVVTGAGCVWTVNALDTTSGWRVKAADITVGRLVVMGTGLVDRSEGPWGEACEATWKPAER